MKWIMQVAVFTMLCVAAAASTAVAIPIAEFRYTEQAAGGWWNYDLTVTNTSAAGEELFVFDFSLPESTIFKGIFLPEGWSDSLAWDGTEFSGPVNPMPFADFGYEIRPGNSNHFVFALSEQLTSPVFTAVFTGEDPENPPIGSFEGVLITSAVPEPTTFLLLSAGLAGAVILRRKRKI